MLTETEFHYGGTELDLFAKAVRWKAYYRRIIAPFLRGDVLEVGAGTGTNTVLLAGINQGRWLCAEPDAQLARRIPAAPGREILVGDLSAVPESDRFDAILYIDVMEHIEDDRQEAARAARLLRKGGHLIVLGPAHQWLYTPFDKAIGHFRRYTRSSLAALKTPGLEPVLFRYLDSAGLLASLGNRLLLRQSMPTEAQILTWDRTLVPVSRILDPLFLYTVGKSAVAIWRKSAP